MGFENVVLGKVDMVLVLKGEKGNVAILKKLRSNISFAFTYALVISFQ